MVAFTPALRDERRRGAITGMTLIKPRQDFDTVEQRDKVHILGQHSAGCSIKTCARIQSEPVIRKQYTTHYELLNEYLRHTS